MLLVYQQFHYPSMTTDQLSRDSKSKVMVGLDWKLSEALDHYRFNSPSINRSALLNQIVLEWLIEKGIWEV